MKVKILKWNAVATWRWDINDDDVCGICQVHFEGTCPTCKYPGDECSLLSGKCGHNFHLVRKKREIQTDFVKLIHRSIALPSG
ncbi:Anaphase-promoting complex subunit 11 [Golovinomyces cichoracearum]|uniref:Anaphase-promoting complex subunit 11 n=1 Tax=Golovinomyces cichoracearum TaxID=62708 RepID=A0A420JBR7_9PEZI|nr:Anaphase-promoting complex subunit 11 [Golovinomyces cichoracearum]